MFSKLSSSLTARTKRIICVILAFCLVFVSVVQVGFVSAADTAEKTMLHYSRGSAWQRLLQKVDGTLEAGVEYTVSFNSKFVTGALGSNIFFNLYGYSSGEFANTETTPLRYSKSYSAYTSGKLFESEEISGANTKYTFKLTADEIANMTEYYIGFYFANAAADFYVGDFVLYKSNDTTKTNLLINSENYLVSNRYVDWYNSSKNTWSSSYVEYVPYDETYFPVPVKTMLHYSRGSAWQRLLQKVDGTLEAGVEYTVSFNSKFVTGALGSNIFFNLYGYSSGDFANTEAKPLRYSKSYSAYTSGKLFESEEVYGANTKYTFTLSADEIANMTEYYIGFYFAGAAADFYVGDFVLYKSNDTTKTNLLINSENYLVSNRYVDWYNNIKNTWSSSYVEYVPYDETYFPIPVKTMLHYSRGSAWQRLLQKVDGTLEAGVEYTVSFNSKFVTGALGSNIFFNLYGYSSGEFANTETTPLRYSKSYSAYTSGKLFESEEVYGANTKYTFTLSADEIANMTEYYIGFYFANAAADFYVGDFVLYKSNDTTKTNLLINSENYLVSNRYVDWYNNIKNTWSSSYVEYVPYDETYFPIPVKTMLHAVRTASSENKLVLKLDEGSIEADTEYTIFFKHKFVSRALNSNVYFGLFGETSAAMYADKMIYASSTYGKSFITAEADDVTATYTFTLTADELAKYTALYMGFYFGQSETDADFYIADFVMYKSADASKTNLLPKNEYSIDMSGWYNNYHNGAGTDYPTVYALSQYVPYDDSYFPVPEIPVKTMFNIKRTADTENKLVLKLTSGTIEADTEYTIEYKYHFDGRNLDSGVYFVFMGDKDGKSPWSDTFFNGSSKYGEPFITQYKDGAFAKFTFSLNAEQIATVKDFYIGFYFSAMDTDADFYIADYILYKSADTEKKNLLPKNEYSTDKSGWYNDYNNDSVSSYVPYNESIFVAVADTNLYGDANLDDGEWWKPEDVVEVDTRGTASISGTLKDQNSVALSGVKLVLVGEEKSYSATTNSEGEFSFKNFIADFYELFVIDSEGQQKPTGYFAHFGNGDTATVDIVSDTSNVVVETEPVITGTLMGTVYTPTLETVSGIKMYLRNYGETVTDANGYFEFKDVPVGDYELYTLLDDGSEYVFRTATVKENVELSMKLKYDVEPEPVQVDESKPFNWIWIAVAVGAAVLVAAGVVVIIVLKKKKNSSK